MSADIATWLANPADFAAGAALYATTGGSAVYRQLFELGETTYSRQVLERLLRMLSSVPELIIVPETPAILVATSCELPATSIAPDPEALADVRARIKQARDERSQLHAQLTTPRLHRAIRGTMAQRICALTTLVGELLATEAHLLEYGRLPGPLATNEVADAGELRRRLSNAISRRAKLRKLPARGSDLPALETEINLIREKLKTTNSCQN